MLAEDRLRRRKNTFSDGTVGRRRAEHQNDTAGWLSDANISELRVNRVLRGKYCWATRFRLDAMGMAKMVPHPAEDVIEQSRLFANKLVASAARSGDPDKVRAYTRRMTAGLSAPPPTWPKGNY